MVLQKENSIQLKTALGTSEIQLLTGDITQLQQDEAVDIVLVSAFQGDYSEVSSFTLIGALSRRLNISVSELSRDKELDLRANFNCWVSKPLPHNVPYRRLVCFERGRRAGNGTTAQQISTMFRAMTPIFNNEETTVITPLLATGNQGQSKVAVLKAMVDGACHWIKAGLPLRCLKIVLYAAELNMRDIEAVKLFKQLKKVWEKQNLTQPEEDQSIDVFISHSNHDNHWADKIATQLTEIRPGLKVYKQQLQFSADEVWQENVFHVMMQSVRIITILSPAYVESQECLEQFNIALCVDRLSAHHQIYPMYVETVACLPSYMQLVQYVECREQAGGEVTQTLIKNACVKILSSVPEARVAGLEDSCGQAQCPRSMYDVFISYSHSYTDPAENLLQCLQEQDSTLSVFLDTSELETGSSWQQSLYNAMDNSRCVVALLSPDYVKSDVCEEEYNIGLARVLAGEDVCLIPVCIEPMETVPHAFSYVTILDGCAASEKEALGFLNQVSEDVIKFVKHGKKGTVIRKPTLSVTPKQAQELRRKQEFDELYKLEGKDIVYKVSNQQSTYDEQRLSRGGQRIVFSFSHDSLRLAIILSELINQASPDTNCTFISEYNKDRLHLLDQSQLVVIIVSDGYSQSAQLLEELHLSLCRQRREKPRRMMYLIEGLHLRAKPQYLHLLDYKVSITDKLWTALTPPRKKSFKDTAPVNECFTTSRGGMGGTYNCSLAERLALSKAALEILDIVNNRSVSGSCMNILNTASLITEVGDSKVPLRQVRQTESVIYTCSLPIHMDDLDL
ncbi:uncharacterized protein LOC124119725 isoform X3 [Haliotis rufescens]|uniref:uncharacterized protein LOC124119725 isoform X3 n=1 Tax=Haliotis rufescens TaxID=6454 RepID=UPI00201FA8F2|nr:uncharacterized protein LOC124119725 isoform X3 [Haliotis rufescens]